jgi:hypothetical protein
MIISVVRPVIRSAYRFEKTVPPDTVAERRGEEDFLIHKKQEPTRNLCENNSGKFFCARGFFKIIPKNFGSSQKIWNFFCVREISGKTKNKK